MGVLNIFVCVAIFYTVTVLGYDEQLPGPICNKCVELGKVCNIRKGNFQSGSTTDCVEKVERLPNPNGKPFYINEGEIPCGKPFEVGSGRENITSQPHNVPKYEHNVDCKILIHRSADALSTLYFDFFDMEDDLFCSKDALDITYHTADGTEQLAQMCGKSADAFAINVTGSFHLRMRTNDMVELHGFKIDAQMFDDDGGLERENAETLG